jgi:membrane protease subunit (stomatin/prohibitin family)
MAVIERARNEGPKGALVWRHPPGDLSWDTQVVVEQDQEAIFFAGGEMLDSLGPGSHPLSTADVPRLRQTIAAPFGGRSPFAAEIYFVDKAADLGVIWETKHPLPILEPRFNVVLPVRASGSFRVRVAVARTFAARLSALGAEPTNERLVENCRGIALAQAMDGIAETLSRKRIDLLDIAAYREDASRVIDEKLSAEFVRAGVRMGEFSLDIVDVLDGDEAVLRLRNTIR